MGTVKRIDNEYYIEFYARGLLYQKKAGKDLNAAKALLKETEDKIKQGEMGIIVRDIELAIFFKSFLEGGRLHYSKKTLRRFKWACENLTCYLNDRHCGVTMLSQITPQIIEDFRSHWKGNPSQQIKNGKSARNFNVILILLREIFEYGRSLGYINDHPTLHIRLLEWQRKYKPLFLTDEDQRKLEEDKGVDQAALFIDLAFLTGLRREEIVNLSYQDFSAADYSVLVNRRGRRIKLPVDQGVFLTLSLKSNPRKKGRIFSAVEGEMLIKSANEKLKQLFNGRYNLIHLRNTFIRSCILRGMPMTRLNQIAGFVDIAQIFFIGEKGLHALLPEN